ncbi:MAG: undecaprenyl-diphosphate phosphatase [Desulfobacterales bacterium]|nr:undecaprenyl-diphosphate phosphatase [Desulfobacterales bacterium]MBF0395488.1 undecaprenyl-diphosphate phosphatase [Desulfobacterales bacterium]
MNSIEAIALGAIQGLTEFLPVSSSAHLVIFQHLFGLKEPQLLFDISVHVGTLIAVCIVLWREIWDMILSIISLFNNKLEKKEEDLKLVLFIILATIPTGVLGLMFHKAADELFSSIPLVGVALIFTSIFLFGTKFLKKDGEQIFAIKEALLIGLVQGMAVIPGISRSGATITAALFLGISREKAAKFSFLLSIPAILGAEIIGLKDASCASIDITILLGVISAAVVGYIAIQILLRIVKDGRLYYFAPYCAVVGILALIFGGL